jgi:hypothetical protein
LAALAQLARLERRGLSAQVEQWGKVELSAQQDPLGNKEKRGLPVKPGKLGPLEFKG